MDNSGSLNAQIIHQLGPGLRSKMAIQVSGGRVGCSPSHPEHQVPLALNPRTQRTVRPNRPKHQSLVQRKAYRKDQARDTGGLCSEDPNSPIVYAEEFLKTNSGGGGLQDV